MASPAWRIWRKVGRVALKALIYFEVLTTLALVLGLVAVNVLQPGVGMNVDLSHVDTASVTPYIAQTQAGRLRNSCSASSPTLRRRVREGNVLQVLFVSVLCGFALTRVGEAGKPLTDLIGRVANVLPHRRIVMWAAPMGAFGAIAFTVGRVRCRLAGVFGQAPGRLLCHLPGLHFRRAVADLRVLRLQPVPLHPLYAGRTADRDRDHVVGNRAAAHDREAGSARLRRERGRAGDPTGYSFNLDGTCLYLATAAVFSGAGDKHAAARSRSNSNCWRCCCSPPRARREWQARHSSCWPRRSATVGTIPVASVAISRHSPADVAKG